MIAKQAVPINFAHGLDTKTDPKQVQIGKFLSLVNTIFLKGGLLQKRNGFGPLTALPDSSSSYLTTFNDNLTTISNSINAYNVNTQQWVQKGSYQPIEVSALPLIRNNLNQAQCDTAITNGMVLTTYASINNGTSTFFFAIADDVTGQNIVPPTAIPPLSSGAISGFSRVFIVGNFFVIVSPVLISAVSHLQYVSIPINNPVINGAANVSAPQNVNSDVYGALTANPGWDGVVSVANKTLVIAYNTTTGAQGIHVTTLTQHQIATNSASTIIKAFANAAYIGNIVSICSDTTVNPNIFYVSFWNGSTNNGYTCAVYIGFGTITTQFNPQQIINNVHVLNLASAAQNGSCLVFSEVLHAYSYDSGVQSNFINAVTVSSAGSVGTPYVAVRGVGLGSKAFIVNATVFFLAAYQSPFQPTYFLMNGLTTAAAPLVVAKLAYENGGGYVLSGLPSVNVIGNVAQVSYLYKDLVQALNTVGNTQQTTAGGIYSQTGVNLATFTIGNVPIASSEIGKNLNIGGGFGWMYDGYLPVEQNFFLWPDSVEVAGSGTSGAMTAQQYYYQVVYEWSDNQGNIFRSAPSIPVTVTLTSQTAVTVNVPYLRLTYKTANPVKIIIYRWSTANQVYYQVTSITAPQLNDTTSDSLAYTDTLADSSIIGNSIIYTTGGVVEDVNPPAYNVTTLFDTRQWFILAEDGNVLGFTKQIIENTPVEFSDLFTYYVAPNSGTAQSTGVMKVIFPMDDKLIIWKKGAMFYINGTGPDNTGANNNYSQPIFITSAVGSENPNSVVLTPEGLMFQSTGEGIWLLNRSLGVSYIGAPVESFNSSTVLSALNVPGTTQVRFTLDTGEHLLYDYYYNEWGVFEGASAVSSCVYQNLHTFLNSKGQIYQETPGVFLDGSNPVLMSFLTGHIQLQGISGYERIFEIQLLGQYFSPHLLNIKLGYDFGELSEQALITPTNFTGIYGSDDIYGQTSPFGGPGSLEQWRIQTGTQKCQAFQISLQEVYDPSFGNLAGAGFTLSAMTCVLGLNRGYRPVKAANTIGTSN